MIRYALAAAPRRDLAGAMVALVLTLAAILRWAAMWRGLGLAVVVLVAYAAWTMDEPAAAIVDTAPRSLRWRTTARLLMLLPAGCCWLVFAAVMSRRPTFPSAGSESTLALVGLGGLVLGAAAATWLRRRGWAAPGAVTATGVGLAVAGLGAFPKHLPLQPAPFPGTGAHEWAWSRGFWAAVAVLAIGVLATATSERTALGFRRSRRRAAVPAYVAIAAPPPRSSTPRTGRRGLRPSG